MPSGPDPTSLPGTGISTGVRLPVVAASGTADTGPAVTPTDHGGGLLARSRPRSGGWNCPRQPNARWACTAPSLPPPVMLAEPLLRLPVGYNRQTDAGIVTERRDGHCVALRRACHIVHPRRSPGWSLPGRWRCVDDLHHSNRGAGCRPGPSASAAGRRLVDVGDRSAAAQVGDGSDEQTGAASLSRTEYHPVLPGSLAAASSVAVSAGGPTKTVIGAVRSLTPPIRNRYAGKTDRTEPNAPGV